MDSSPAGGRVAYGDESYLEAVSGGYYVLASVTFDPSVAEEARQAMRELRGNRRTDKLHWNEMDRKQREAAAFTVASLEGFHVVAVGAPVPLKRQERARAACLTRLVDELYGYEVRTLVLESRGRTLDKKANGWSGHSKRSTTMTASRSGTNLAAMSHCYGRLTSLPEQFALNRTESRGTATSSTTIFTMSQSSSARHTRPQKRAEPGSRSAPGHLAPRLLTSRRGQQNSFAS